MEDLSKIVKNISFSKQKNYKGIVSYKVKLELTNGSSTEVPVDNDDITLITALKTAGIDEPVKSKRLVEDENEEGKKYYSIDIELADGETTLRYFNFSFNFRKVIDLVRKVNTKPVQEQIKK